MNNNAGKSLDELDEKLNEPPTPPKAHVAVPKVNSVIQPESINKNAVKKTVVPFTEKNKVTRTGVGAAVKVNSASDSTSTAPEPKQLENEGNAVLWAMIANIVVAAIKFVVAGLSHSASMMSEAIHSTADSFNEVTLIVGEKLSHRPPTKQFPQGWSRLRYLASFIVAIFLFVVGGVYSAMESANKISSLTDGTPGGHAVDTVHLWIAFAVVIASAVMESFSLHKSIEEAKERFHHSKHPGEFHLFKFWRGTKSSDLAAVLAEDVLALASLFFSGAGILLSIITKDAIWDAFGGLMVGFVLLVGAVALGVQIGSLIIGEGGSEHDYAIVDRIIENDPNVVRQLHPAIIEVRSPDRIEITLKLEFKELTDTLDGEAMKRLLARMRRVSNSAAKGKDVTKETENISKAIDKLLTESKNDVDVCDEIDRIESLIRNEITWYEEVDINIEPSRYDPELAKKVITEVA